MKQTGGQGWNRHVDREETDRWPGMEQTGGRGWNRQVARDGTDT